MNQQLPISRWGRHAMVYSLLDEPSIKAELRAYVRSNKWAMNPTKLGTFLTATAIPAAGHEYVHQAVEKEMPCGLKKYFETVLLP